MTLGGRMCGGLCSVWARYRCQRCGLAGQLHCHHVRQIERYPHADHYDPEFLIALCRRCHYARENHPLIPKSQLQIEHAAWDRAVREL